MSDALTGDVTRDGRGGGGVGRDPLGLVHALKSQRISKGAEEASRGAGDLLTTPKGAPHHLTDAERIVQLSDRQIAQPFARHDVEFPPPEANE